MSPVASDSDACVGSPAPAFELPVIDGAAAATRTVRLADFTGRWLALLFYPHDFSFVCPTELTAFSARAEEFRQLGCELLAASTDSLEMHREWLETPEKEGGLGPLQFPLASDRDATVARRYYSWDGSRELVLRGLHIIDPAGILQYSVVHNLSVGRSVDEILRVLAALQRGGLCPANWRSADGLLDPERVLAAGKVLGHYRIRRRLGGGSFGAVFSAVDLRLQRTVAIKILRERLNESRAALLAEARSIAALSHPAICVVYAVEEHDGLPLIVMEYLDGGSLADLLREGLDDNQVRTIVRTIASALTIAHAQSIVHGDLKPANVLRTQSGQWKLVDFGLASSPDVRPAVQPAAEPMASSDPEATIALAAPHSAGITGTPAYMSPEQSRGERLTPASDIFSLGLIAFELLAGRRAIDASRVGEALALLGQADFGTKLAAALPDPWQELLSRMLSAAAAQRPAAAEVVEYLRE